MSEIRVTDQEDAKPEVRVNFTVYFHAADIDEASDRSSKIRYFIEEALADEDNGLTTFTYPETRTNWADKFGKAIGASRIFDRFFW